MRPSGYAYESGMTVSALRGQFRMRVVEREADLADQFGVDIDEALNRWEMAGGQDGGEDAGTWLWVAFMFARHDRVPTWKC